MSKVALVAGAGGVIGKALMEEIADTPGWEALALSRSHGGTEADVISDMTKIRLAGFHGDADPIDALIRAIERQQDAGVLPRIGSARSAASPLADDRGGV